MLEIGVDKVGTGEGTATVAGVFSSPEREAHSTSCTATSEHSEPSPHPPARPSHLRCNGPYCCCTAAIISR